MDRTVRVFSRAFRTHFGFDQMKRHVDSIFRGPSIASRRTETAFDGGIRPCSCDRTTAKQARGFWLGASFLRRARLYQGSAVLRRNGGYLRCPAVDGGERLLRSLNLMRQRRRVLHAALRVVVAVVVACGSSARHAWAQEDAAPDHLPGGEMVRGKVTAVTPNGLTLRSEDGEQYQVVATTNTRVIRSRQPARFSDLRVGDGVGAGGVMDGAHHTLHAAFIGAIDADEVRKAEAELGKSYLIGRITAINLDALRLTVHRPDGVNQVIAVDEGTSFRRGGRDSSGENANEKGRGGARQPAGDTGESITLADIKVGESVAAKGGLKDRIFVPTELHVYAAEGRRRHMDEAGAPAAPTASGVHP